MLASVTHKRAGGNLSTLSKYLDFFMNGFNMAFFLSVETGLHRNYICTDDLNLKS